ncbi:MAG: dTDP-4-dehydrorhamnose reductase [Bdellovibrionota bacterium]
MSLGTTSLKTKKSSSGVDYLITGANGQLGRELQDKLSPLKNVSFEAFSREGLDITNPTQLEEAVDKYNPEYIINCAAFTAVDSAESGEGQKQCEEINHKAVERLANLAIKYGFKLIHISTDYVFGRREGPALTEEDETQPLNVYGKTKLLGEEAIRKALTLKDKNNYLIVRTSSVHGQYGKNFVKTMIRKLLEEDEITVVGDQIMNPTYAGYLADTILELNNKGATGTFNVSNTGEISWYDFVLEIRDCLSQVKPEVMGVIIKRCTSKEFQEKANRLVADRPEYSAFKLTKLEDFLKKKAMTWQGGLKEHFNDLGYMVK